MEQSRAGLEKQGVRIAAVSYDSPETLRRFAEKYRIGFPLLSDSGSAVIRSFGIFNTNMSPGLRAYGVPHPVEYLVSPEGAVLQKFFVPNYQHRVAGSAIVLRQFGVADEQAPMVALQSGALTVQIGLSSARAFAGQEVGFFAKFVLEAGWHVYGAPLPAAYTPTSVVFHDSKIVRQSFELPETSPLHIAVLDEVLPVFEGAFQGRGSLLLKFPLDAGSTLLSGEVQFQQCSTDVCEPPETLAFELPLTLDPFLVATQGTV